MYLERIPKRINRKFGKKRVGRGGGSGKGSHTVGRGQKGQKSRTGHKSMIMFEGGNVPFFRRMPKYRGFKQTNKVEYQPINLNVLEENYKAGETVSLETLRAKALIRKNVENVKILSVGNLNKALVVSGLAASESAREKILAAKGSIT